jgi:hypothetical protein
MTGDVCFRVQSRHLISPAERRSDSIRTSRAPQKIIHLTGSGVFQVSSFDRYTAAL